MGGKQTKEQSYCHISRGKQLKLIEHFKKHAKGREKMDRDEFKNAFPQIEPVLIPFYRGVVQGDECGMLSWKALFGFVDRALLTQDNESAALRQMFGDNKKEMIESITNMAANWQNMNEKDQAKLGEYFSNAMPQTMDNLPKFLISCPLFETICHAMFASILEVSPPSLIPTRVSDNSEIMTMVDRMILKWALPTEMRDTWTLLFASSQMGDSFSQMVKRINHEGPVIVIIESTTHKRFGFFASHGFHSGSQYHGDHQCFLFELDPLIRTYQATGMEQTYAYLNYQQQRMPNGMGIAGHDDIWPLFIREEFGSGTCQKNTSAFEKSFVAGQSEFNIHKIEVWRVGEKPVERDEEGQIIENKEKSIIDKDPEARAILEMSGRAMHSDAYREPAPLLDDENA